MLLTSMINLMDQNGIKLSKKPGLLPSRPNNLILSREDLVPSRLQMRENHSINRLLNLRKPLRNTLRSLIFQRAGRRPKRMPNPPPHHLMKKKNLKNFSRSLSLQKDKKPSRKRPKMFLKLQ